MSTPEKEALVQEMAEILKEAKSVFITDFQGLNVEKMGKLREKCREASVVYRVVKNTLARLAAKQIGMDEIVDYFDGPSAIAYSYDDPAAPARIVTEFAKTADKPTIKASIFEGNFYGPDRVGKIASLPTRPELIADVIGTFNAPIQRLVGNLNGLIQKLVGTLHSVQKTKEGA
jgi:large subunit ribosomal protein L10